MLIAVVVVCAVALPMMHPLSTIMLGLILVLLIVAVVGHSVRRIGPKGEGMPQEHLWPLLPLAASSLLVSSILWSVFATSSSHISVLRCPADGRRSEICRRD